MKTKEELNVIKEKVKSQNNKLAELTDEELAQVSGGYSGENQSVVVQLLKLVEAGNEEQSIKLFNAYYKYMTAEGVVCFFSSFYVKFGYQMTQSPYYCQSDVYG